MPGAALCFGSFARVGDEWSINTIVIKIYHWYFTLPIWEIHSLHLLPSKSRTWSLVIRTLEIYQFSYPFSTQESHTCYSILKVALLNRDGYDVHIFLQYIFMYCVFFFVFFASCMVAIHFLRSQFSILDFFFRIWRFPFCCIYIYVCVCVCLYNWIFYRPPFSGFIKYTKSLGGGL
jgi:hypothetical protein